MEEKIEFVENKDKNCSHCCMSSPSGNCCLYYIEVGAGLLKCGLGAKGYYKRVKEEGGKW